jgi:hypothetical protein|nr:MAG TPA: hypothetical protein [Caudoviricetes sp.]
MSSPYLQHHGVLGMRWGVRRDNNSGSSGEPSRFGRFRRNVNVNDTMSMINNSKTLNNEAYKLVKNKSVNKHKKTAEQMTNKELQDAITRMNLEKQFSSLSAERTTAGKVSAMEALEAVGTVLTIAGAAASLYGTVKSVSGR